MKKIAEETSLRASTANRHVKPSEIQVGYMSECFCLNAKTRDIDLHFQIKNLQIEWYFFCVYYQRIYKNLENSV